MATVVTQDKAKSGDAATSMKKLTFTGIRAHYTRGALTFGAMIEKGKNNKDGGNSELKANEFSVSAKANKLTYSIAYAQAKGEFPQGTIKAKTTSLEIAYKG